MSQPLDRRIRRRMMMSHNLGKRRAEETAAQNMNAIVDRFEAVNAATIAEIKELRNALVRAHMIDAALAAERESVRWLN